MLLAIHTLRHEQALDDYRQVARTLETTKATWPRWCSRHLPRGGVSAAVEWMADRADEQQMERLSADVIPHLT